MTKKILSLFLSILFLFCACQKPAQVDGNVDADIQTQENAETVAQSEEGETSPSQNAEAPGEENSKNAAALSATKPNASQAQHNQNPQKPQHTEKTPETPQTPEKPQEDIHLTPVPSTNVKPDPKKDITVSVAVDCHTAIEWGILQKKPQFQGVLPENGKLLSTSVTVKEGECAMKALKTALKKNRIAIDESDGYIRSIAGLSEFDCGRSSGWLYRVNGQFPNVSSADYPLKNGDTIEFIYTCQRGDIFS